MAENAQHAQNLEAVVDGEPLREWLRQQRWYAAKSRGISGIDVIEHAPIDEDLFVVLAQVKFATGTHDIYQLVVGEGEHYQGLEDPSRILALVRLLLQDAELQTDSGRFSFRHIEGALTVSDDSVVRAMGAEQSNSSFVIDERTVVKMFRKVESGISPELELLRFLTARGFEHIAPLQGWYEYEGSSLASTLGIVQQFVPEGRDGWQLALQEIATDLDRFTERAQRLGQITGEMHTLLGSDPGDPAFSPQEPTTESMSLLTASIDDDIERIFMRLPDTPDVAPIYGRGEDVRAKLAERGRLGAGGKQIRIHGDYHLGQTLDSPRGWVILDFEGEPARPLPERRQKRSPLRDVAGMLRSFAYAASSIERQGATLPDDAEQRIREAFLSGYLTSVDAALLPAGAAAISNMLSVFELEKAVYELQYELDNRPDWVGIPVTGIQRLIEAR